MFAPKGRWVCNGLRDFKGCWLILAQEWELTLGEFLFRGTESLVLAATATASGKRSGLQLTFPGALYPE